jgi:hypothetical protein
MINICRISRIISTILILASSHVFAGECAAADTSAIPSAAQVLADNKAATGGDAWDRVTTITSHCEIKQGGLTGTDDNWQDVVSGKYADTFTIGGVAAGDGYDGVKSWSVDASGITRNLDSDTDLQSASTNSYITSLAYWYPARRPGAYALGSAVLDSSGHTYWIVTVMPDGGFPVDLWFDTGSKLLVRSVEKNSRLTLTTTFSDFRQVDGVTLPFRNVISSGETKYDMTITVASVSINAPTSPAIFSPPVPPVPDYTIANGEASVTVPFQFTVNHIYVPVKINGQGPYEALLDTGGQLAVTPEFASANKIDSAGKLPASGIGPNTVSQSVAKVATLQIGDITINNLTAAVLPMPTPPNNPLIGAEIFRRFAVHIDFDKQLLTLTPLSTFVYSGSGLTVPFHFAGNVPVVAGNLDGFPGSFMIDTGSGNTLDLFPSFVSSNGLAAKYSSPFSAISGYGVGGATTASVARAVNFAVGPVSVSNIVIFLSHAQLGSYSDTSIAGNIGNGFLRRFNLTFDYQKQDIIFEPNVHFADPDSYERLGITFDGGQEGCGVTFVIPGSPADQAGIAVGDTIESVNGQNVSQENAAFLEEQLLLPANTVLDLLVKHGHKTKDIKVILRDLI